MDFWIAWAYRGCHGWHNSPILDLKWADLEWWKFSGKMGQRGCILGAWLKKVFWWTWECWESVRLTFDWRRGKDEAVVVVSGKAVPILPFVSWDEPPCAAKGSPQLQKRILFWKVSRGEVYFFHYPKLWFNFFGAIYDHEKVLKYANVNMSQSIRNPNPKKRGGWEPFEIFQKNNFL